MYHHRSPNCLSGSTREAIKSWARMGLQVHPKERRRQAKAEEAEDKVKAPRT